MAGYEPTVGVRAPREPGPPSALGVTQTEPPRPVPERRPIGVHLALVALLATLAVLAWWRVWITGHPTSTITCGCGDPSQELWLFAWVPYAVSHWTNPLFTNLLDAGQGGVNVMWDANNLFAAFVLAPITAAFGPVASFNTAALIAPVLSGWAFFLAAGRISRFIPGQIAGAVLWAFSPFVIWNSPFGHANLTWLFFPPLLFVLAYDLCARPSVNPAAVGRWIGVLTVVQFFVSNEVLLISAIGAAICALFAAIASPRSAWALRARVGKAAAWAAVISLPLLAYPVWYAVAGPQHIIGAPWAAVDLQTQVLHASTIVTAREFSEGSPLDQVFGYYGGLPPTFFLGVALLAFLAASATVWYRRAVAWLLIATGGLTTLFSLGAFTVTVTPLSLAESKGKWWMAWRFFATLPVLRDLQPYRFVIVSGFAVAMLVTISADRWWRAAPNRFPTSRSRDRPPLRRGWRTFWALVLSLVLAGVLWSVADVYDLPFVVHADAQPAWLSSSTRQFPSGTRVLILPTSFPLVTMAMSWQAAAGLPFALEGGYAVVPGPSSLGVYSLPQVGGGGVLDRLSSGLPAPASTLTEVRQDLVTWRVGIVALDGTTREAVPLRRYIDEVTRIPPRHVGSWWLWQLSPPGRGRPRPSPQRAVAPDS